MCNDYTIDFNNYLIPAEEGIFSITKKIFTRNKINLPSNNSTQNKNKNNYSENVNMVISKMKKECPDVIKSEMTARFSESKKLITIINTLKEKYKKTPGVIVTSDNLRSYLDASKKIINKNNFDQNSNIVDCAFLQDLLPSVKPTFYTYKDRDKIDYQDWFYRASWTITYATSDIHDWAEATYGDKYRNNEISVRDYEITKEYYDIINNISEDLNMMCKHLSYFMTDSYGGDWDDGIQDIVFKPSYTFLAIARKFGYVG